MGLISTSLRLRGSRATDGSWARGWGISLQRIQPSTAAFAAIMVAIGIWGLTALRFVAIWAPGIQPPQLRIPMVIVCSLFSIVTGAGLLWPRSAPIAARLLLGFLCLWLVWCKGVALVRAPTVLASWESLGETAVVMSATWAAAQPIAELKDRSFSPFLRRGPRVLYGAAMIAFGASHLAYARLTASLVPAWLPWHWAWVYFTAATYIAAGLALLGGLFATLAASLSTVQMALFGVLVWLPRIVEGARDPDTLNEAAISFALAASGWVLTTALKSDHSSALGEGSTQFKRR